MAKIVNYRCEGCGDDFEELYSSEEEQLEELEEKCGKCGGKFVKFNFKNNCHAWHMNPFD